MTVRAQWMVVGAFGLTLATAVVVGLSQPRSDSRIGQPAPAFGALNTATGDSVSLAPYQGQVVLLNIWATWCPPCEAEMPALQRLYQDLGPEGLRILAVSVDEEASADSVKKWADNHHLTFDILQDETRKIEDIYRTIGVPESFVIDRQGRVVKRVTGFVLEWDAPAQKALFRRLLKSEERPETGDARREQTGASRLSSLVSRPLSPQ